MPRARASMLHQPEENCTLAKLMFYERPMALNRERHKHLKLAAAPDHFKFAATTNALPIMSTEFAETARHLPIVFVGDEGGPFSVAALVGLRDGQNLMVDSEGRWTPGAYVPAFARRYPFVLAKTDDSDRFTVCVDEVYSGLGTESGEPLFDEQGAETPYLRRVLDFLQAFQAEAKLTSEFAGRLKELGLLVPKVIRLERKGQPMQTLRGLWIVDSAKLRGIDNARVVELFRNGYLAWIEAHLISLGSLSRLVDKIDRQTAVSDEKGQVAPSADAGAGEPAPDS
jgi:hypothetical protein